MRTLAVVTAAGTVVLGGPTTAHAAEAQSGSVEVSGLPLTVDFQCLSTCPYTVSATSSGSISGVDGTTPFNVSWTDPPLGGTNVSASISYNPTCVEEEVSVGAVLLSSTLTVSGAQLAYGTSTGIPASVELFFTGRLAEGVLVPFTTEVLITGGGHSIDIAYLGIPGSMPAVPLNAPVLCNGVQNFTASGVFLTLAP